MIKVPNPDWLVRHWYDHSKDSASAFFRDLEQLDCDTLVRLLGLETALSPRGSLRTKVQLEALNRAQRPSIQDLQMREPDEQTLQWMFMHRKHLLSISEEVAFRELPTCCEGESVEGRADLLAFDQLRKQPIIVELKRKTASDPLSGVVLEALSHWAFNVRHLADFKSLLFEFGCVAEELPRVVIAAPEGYYRSNRKRTRPPRGKEFYIAKNWIECLRQREVVTIDLYTTEDDWLSEGPDFVMGKI
jgi:hypothetical protein